MLNHIVTKSIGKHLAWQRRNRNPRALPLQDIAEVLEIRIASADGRLAQLEGRNVGSANDLVVGVHVPTHAVGSWVLDLWVLDESLEVKVGCAG